MKIVLASESKVKVAAVHDAFKHHGAELVTVNVPSGINEQPMNGETLTGAFNRLKAAREKVPDADLYISIENGIFEEHPEFVDRAIVAISRGDADPEVIYSEGVVFPKEAVKEAMARGLDKITVGKVMAEMGIVKDHADPHYDLRNIHRADILAKTMKQAVGALNLG